MRRKEAIGFIHRRSGRQGGANSLERRRDGTKGSFGPPKHGPDPEPDYRDTPTGTGVRSGVSLPRLLGRLGSASGAGVWSGVVLGADWDRRPSGRREWRRGAATQPGNDATPAGHPQGVPLRSSGIGSFNGRRGTGKSSLLIPRETGRGLSISGAHRVTVVERPRRGDPCGRPPPERRPRPPAIAWALPNRGGWSGDFLVADWERRPERRLERASSLGADWDRRPSGRREWRRGAATQPGNDATPQGVHKGCPYGHRGLEVSMKKGELEVRRLDILVLFLEVRSVLSLLLRVGG